MSKDLKTASPREVRALIRAGEITSPTAGMAAGYAQANLVILPAEYAADGRRSYLHAAEGGRTPCGPQRSPRKGSFSPARHILPEYNIFLFRFFNFV